MYLDYFGLKKPPFCITPDTSLFFEGAERGDVLDAVLYALNAGEGIIKVVGEVGSGKTMLTRMLTKKAPGNTVFIFLLNPRIQAEQVLYAIAYDLGLQVDAADKSIQVLHVLQKKLFDLYSEGKEVVLIVDEAQQMPLATLEEIRLLSNLETETEKLLQIVLFGQPELDKHIDAPSVRQLRERITYSFYLSDFSWQVADKYLNFRLGKAGHQGRVIFTSNAIKLLTKYAGGTLRRLNVLADKSLLAAFLEKSPEVDVKHVKLALKDSAKGCKKSQAIYYIALSVFLLLGVAGFAGYLFLQAEEGRVESSSDQGRGENALMLKENPATLDINALKENALLAPVVSTSKMGERVKAFNAWVSSTNDLYTIQLMSSLGGSSTSELEGFVRLALKRLDSSQIYVKNTPEGAHIVYYRSFSSYSRALKELNKLPSVMRRNKPFVSNIKK